MYVTDISTIEKGYELQWLSSVHPDGSTSGKDLDLPCPFTFILHIINMSFDTR
jgi:hypothetical protein